MLNEDYNEMLQCLAAEGVKFLLVGAYALAFHGFPRATMDMDLWIMPSPENAEATLRALRRFGAPTQDLSVEELQKGNIIFQIGVAPRRIDLMTGVSGLEFNQAYQHALEAVLEGVGAPVRVLSVQDLIKNKKALGRAKDLADVEFLESLSRRAQQPPPV